LPKDILKNKKLLAKFTRQIYLAPDTPAVIRALASDAAYMILTQAILNMKISRNLPFFRILSAVCNRQYVAWPRLYEKLEPAACVLGLSPANPDQINYYQILGLMPGATDLEIKKAFRKCAFATHPDSNNSADQSGQVFADVYAAYQILINSELRDAYNRSQRNSYIWIEIPSGRDRISALKRYLYTKRWFFYQVIAIFILLLVVITILNYILASKMG